MTDPKQIPYLIKLLDDESSDIREIIGKELAAFGSTLKEELKKVALPLNPTQNKYVGKILQKQRRVRLKHIWPSWLDLSAKSGDFAADYKMFEGALSILCEFLSGPKYDFRLKNLLDELASAYKINFEKNDPVQLAAFLFKEKGLLGDEEDYYNPQNSNLVYVIKEKKGVPISLTAIYMLVGLRLGIKVEGCHFPGHFLARIRLDGDEVFVDCFNGGQVIEEKELLKIREEAFEGMENVLHETSDAQTMVRQFLANLIRAYQIQEDKENSKILMELFRTMDRQVNGKRMFDLTPEDIINYVKPVFRSGQRVGHVRYGYHGIIVDVDDECKATDDWYYGNQTQPSRHQPWYHVLVHGSDQVTYVAENNLVKDTSEEKMTHSLLSYFFTKSKDGHYIRNDNPWPETDF